MKNEEREREREKDGGGVDDEATRTCNVYIKRARKIKIEG